MIVIINKQQLINNGQTRLDRKARKIALCCFEKAVNKVDPREIVRSKLESHGSILKIEGLSFDLGKFRHIYVVGGGKASGSMAEALEEVLNDRITCGLVNVPKGDETETRIIKLHKASHPIPGEQGIEGTRKMLQIVEAAEEDDLVICLISGGGSSLMPLPRGRISLSDKKALTNALLRSGATIDEINTVRKHISDFKGGWLAKKAYPATVLNLILSDVVGDPLDSIASGPSVPDPTTFAEAFNVLKKYSLWDNAPAAVKKVISEGRKGLIPETPKASDEVFKKVHSAVIGNNRSASLAACEYLESIGLHTVLLTSVLEGMAKEVGRMLASIAFEISASGNPARRPAAIVAGGETTVTVVGKGLGGRNQEIPLSAAFRLGQRDGVVVASLSTDGVDGPTDAAGAISDGKTIARAAELSLSPQDFLADNDSYHFFSKLGDLVFTGPTGTNVNDLTVVIVL